MKALITILTYMYISVITLMFFCLFIGIREIANSPKIEVCKNINAPNYYRITCKTYPEAIAVLVKVDVSEKSRLRVEQYHRVILPHKGKYQILLEEEAFKLYLK